LTINPSTLSSIGYLALVNSTNITVKNLDLMYSGQGILFAHTTNSIISNLTTTGNWNGIEVNAASNVTVIGNNANNNFDFGIKFEHSRNSTVIGNNANNNGWAGIGIFTSQYNVVNANIVNGNINYGIDLVYSANNVVTGNDATSGEAYSMVLYYSNFTLIYHNNFMNHYIYEWVKTANSWDNGLEGNYWNSYDGIDANQDGIGDTPYIIDEGNQDNFPLMGVFSSFNTSLGCQVSVVSNSFIQDFEYFESNRTIRMHVSNMTQSQTFGFVRICIPHVLMNEPYHVTIDGAEPYHVNYTLYDDGENRWIYFSYEHSTREILIVPEFPSFIIIPPFMIATLLAAMVYRRKRRLTRNPTKITKNQFEKF
jgi:parallel beta-helix repeat protein